MLPRSGRECEAAVNDSVSLLCLFPNDYWIDREEIICKEPLKDATMIQMQSLVNGCKDSDVHCRVTTVAT